MSRPGRRAAARLAIGGAPLALACALAALGADPLRADDPKPAPPPGGGPSSAEAPTPSAQPWTGPVNPDADRPRASTPAADAGGIMRLPGVRIDLRRRRVEVDGKICIRQGLIEVFACRPNGKTHESVVKVDGSGRDIKLGLLLLGLVERPQVKNLGDAGELSGERVAVSVTWDEEGHPITFRAEELLLDQHEGRTMELCGFVFTGSRFVKIGPRDVFMADASGQIVTTFHDPDSILDNPLPKGGDDTVYYANSRLLPRAGTPVVLTFEPLAASRTASELRPTGENAPEMSPKPPTGSADPAPPPR